MKNLLPWFKKKKTAQGRVGALVAPSGLALAAIDGQGLLQHCEFQKQAENADDTTKAITDFVLANKLEGQPCSIVLHPEIYQLLLAEAPAVPANEMSQAIRWKIKDLLEIPVEEAAVEHFLLPEDAYRGQRKMLYAAALERQVLEQQVKPWQNAGLEIDCIEVAELAMHNVVARLPSAPGGIAFLQLYEEGGFINLVEDGAIYLSRRLDTGLRRYDPLADNQAFFETLFLEVQRSLDFYESQLGKGIITQLWYAPGLPYTADIGQFLSAQLGLDVSALDFSPLDLVEHLDEELDEQMGLCAIAIGAALGPYDSASQASSQETVEDAPKEVSGAAS